MSSTPVQLPPWTDLDANILSLIAGFCTLEDYASCRGVCSSWRFALPPPPSGPLAVLPADDGTAGHPVSLAVCFVHTWRWYRVPALHQPTKLDAAAECRCVGARDGWVAIVAGGGDANTRRGAVLFNPFTGEEIALDALSLYEPAHDVAPKIAFSSNPTPKDFVAVSICRPNRLAMQRACGSGCFTMIEDTDGFMDGVVLVDVACGDDGSIYALAKDGQVYVLRFERRRRGSRSISVVEVRPLQQSTGLGGDDGFPPPYDTISALTDVKNLVLCDGVLYQIWRRSAGAGSAAVELPPGSGEERWQQKVRVREGDVFILKYETTSWPCWTVAGGKDLCGGAVFVGMNDAAVVRGDGVKPNSVYYWDRLGEGDYEPMVYDMVTRSSIRWPAATGGLSAPLWYFRPVEQRRSVEATDLKPTLADGEATCEESDHEYSPAYMLRKDMRSFFVRNLSLL